MKLRYSSCAALALMTIAGTNMALAGEVFVSVAGSEGNPGSAAAPVNSFAAAQASVRKVLAAKPAEAVTVTFAEGTYYLPETIVFEAQDSGTTEGLVTYRAEEGKKVVISGGEKLSLEWEPSSDGIFKAKVPASLDTDQLFVNGERMILARYPNFNPNERIFNGYAADAISKERAARWSDPAGGFIHAMHRSLWGGFSYRITGKDAAGNATYEGGWQNNRQNSMHAQYRFVENIREELDAPGEWFLDRKKGAIYFYPPAGLDLKAALFETSRLKKLFEFKGTQNKPVRNVRLEGLTLRHALRTFMETKEPLLRSDWTIAREGAVYFNGAEDCALEDCTMDQVGGNAVFVNNYNRRIIVRGCEIDRAGGSGVAFVGDPAAVRNPLFEYGKRQSSADLDLTPGPKTENYPRDCVVEDCLIHETGRVEKQSAGIEIAMSRGIRVSHCTIYGVPRAGINIGDGCWGGDVIEGCDVFETVLETGDHGAFNSWGRDRWWGLKDLKELAPDKLLALTRLDTIEPITLRGNRWRCDHGWDVDLDDGSSNYRIYDNVALAGGIKLREGFWRTLENNIMVNNTFHPHVWYPNSQDAVRHNIVFTAYKPIRVPKPWGVECDGQLLHAAGAARTEPAEVLQRASGRDEHSIVADAKFIGEKNGDWRVAEGSPALALGFTNFPMDRFGVRNPKLKARAKKPSFEVKANDNPVLNKARRDEREYSWMGMKIKNLAGLGEQSATGMGSETGVLVVDASKGADGEKGLAAMDVILKIDDAATPDVAALREAVAARLGKTARIGIQRGQQPATVEIMIGEKIAE